MSETSGGKPVEDWEERQRAIRELLERESIGSQAILVRRLKKRGFGVTQSSVSRDLADLKAVKLDGRYVLRAALVNGEPRPRGAAVAMATMLRAVRPAGPNLLVVKTTPGGAQAIGLVIDQAEWPEVVGTVAGDDTLFIATAGRRDQARIEARLEELGK